MAALSLALLAASLGLIIEGNTACPTPDEVGTALGPLLREEISGTNDHLVLSQTRHGLKVTLLDSRGELLASRLLPSMSSCAAQAHRAAVIAAAWQAELSEEPLPPAPGIRESPETERGARLWPEPVPPAQPSPGYFAIGLRLSYVAVGGLTTAIQLGGGAVWGRWGIEGSGWLELSRTYDVGSVDSQFFRFAGELGPTVLVRIDQPQIQLRAQGVGSALLANGGVLFDPGVEVGARVLVGHRPASGFLDATVTLWPRLFSEIEGLQLSPLEAFLTVGLVLGGS